MTDINTIRQIAEYAPHWLTPEDHRALRDHDPKVQRRVSRWIIAGVVLCAIGLASLPAFADPAGVMSTVIIGTSESIGAAAEVTFYNVLEPTQNEVTVDLGEGVIAHFQMMPGDKPDRMTLTVPDGYITFPTYVDVTEGGQGVIVIYPIEGVGM